MGRRRGRMVGLSLTGFALCMTIYLEFALYREGAPADLVPPDPASSHMEAASSGESAGQRDRWFNEIVSRPLFNPDRRPAGNQDRGGAGLPRLTAIIVDGPRRMAMFEAQAGGHATVVEVGSRIGVYDVRDIADGGMTVVGPEGPIAIRPTFDGAPPVRQTDAGPSVAQFDAGTPGAHRAALPAHPTFFNVTAR